MNKILLINSIQPTCCWCWSYLIAYQQGDQIYIPIIFSEKIMNLFWAKFLRKNWFIGSRIQLCYLRFWKYLQLITSWNKMEISVVENFVLYDTACWELNNPLLDLGGCVWNGWQVSRQQKIYFLKSQHLPPRVTESLQLMKSTN